MTQEALTVMSGLLAVAGGAMALMGLYYGVVALFGFKKQAGPPAAPATARFAVLIAARNEEAVIGQLVDSLRQQRYPAGLYDIIVAPNNCTDATRQVAEAHGAHIFVPQGRVKSKGEVLRQFCAGLLAGQQYDAVCVFDADNLVHPAFLQRMNDALAAGWQVAQGSRDSKNPADTAVSTCYSVCYWMLNRFYNGGREAVGLSALIGGSGFMVSRQLLQRLGGWNTVTLTEDYEFSAQCVLAGEKVHYVADAVIYDEQPLTFRQSWNQRRRWSSGSAQGMELHLGRLVGAAVKRHSLVCADMALTFATPLCQLASVVLGLCTVGLVACQVVVAGMGPLVQWLLLAAAGGLVAIMACVLLAAFVVWLNRGRLLPGTQQGILYFAWFLISWMPIHIISLFKRKTTWDAVAHTRAVSLQEMPVENLAA